METLFTIIGVCTVLYLAVFGIIEAVKWVIDIRVKLRKEIEELRQELEDAKSK